MKPVIVVGAGVKLSHLYGRMEVTPRSGYCRGRAHHLTRGAEMPKGTCSVDGCEKPARSRGWCSMHHSRWLRHGDLTAGDRRERSGRDYVRIRVPGHPLADRRGWAREHRVVAFDAGLLTDLSAQVHHIDGNKLNNAIENLEVLSALEHNREHESWNNGAKANLAKTHCPQGHPYAGDNLHIVPSGERHCRACARDNVRRYRAEKKTGL